MLVVLSKAMTKIMVIKALAKIRQKNLQKIAANYDTQRDFADTIGVTPGYINQLLVGHRTIGEKVARKIEQALKLPPLSLDAPGLKNKQSNNLAGAFEKTGTLQRMFRVNTVFIDDLCNYFSLKAQKKESEQMLITGELLHGRDPDKVLTIKVTNSKISPTPHKLLFELGEHCQHKNIVIVSFGVEGDEHIMRYYNYGGSERFEDIIDTTPPIQIDDHIKYKILGVCFYVQPEGFTP